MAPYTAPGCENGRRQQNNNHHKTEETSLGRVQRLLGGYRCRQRRSAVCRDDCVGSLALITARPCNVRFAPESGHVRCSSSCLLWANSGHCAALLRMPITVVVLAWIGQRS